MGSRPKFPTTGALIAEFKQAERRLGRSALKAEAKGLHVRSLADYVKPGHVLSADEQDIENWLDSRRVQKSTRATYISEVRSFFVWAVKRGYISANPAAEIVRPKQARRLPRPIDDDSLSDTFEDLEAQMARWLDDEHKDPALRRMTAMVCLMAYEGARCIEVSRLRGEYIDTRAMQLVLHGKGDKERAMPLHPETLLALQRYRLPRRGPVIVRHCGLEPTNHALQAATISLYVSRFLPEGYTAHQLRHWFGTWFYRNCKDLLMTQEAMGHANPQTTAVYAQADTSSKADVIGMLSARRGPARLSVVAGRQGWKAG